MNEEEDDWGGKLEFGFSDSSFSKDFKDYFLPFEEKCPSSSLHWYMEYETNIMAALTQLCLIAKRISA